VSVEVFLRLFGINGAPLCRPVGHDADGTPRLAVAAALILPSYVAQIALISPSSVSNQEPVALGQPPGRRSGLIAYELGCGTVHAAILGFTPT
jgi:hypothetical protein